MSIKRPLDITPLIESRPIERFVSIYRLGQEPSEVDLQSHLTPEQRLENSIEHRARLMRLHHGTEPGLERVLVVTRQA
jgi:hypothetical protein